MTTLTDAAAYPKDDIAELYHARWLAELDILRRMTPEMVRKEMWMCLLAYILIRQTMLQSARASGLQSRQLSFTAALQSIAASRLVIVLSEDRVARTLIEAA